MSVAAPSETSPPRFLQLAGHPLPAIYPDSIDLPCSRCGLVLTVGPRIAAEMRVDTEIALVCPFCLTAADLAGVYTITDLGNPASLFEDE